MLNFQNANIGYDFNLFNTGEKILERGKFISLLGKNGCGKSTFFSSLLGLQRVISGKIFIDNKEINIQNRNSNSNFFAYVNTHFTGLNFMSVFELLSLGRTKYTSISGKLKDNDYCIIEEKAKLLNISHLQSKYTNQISDGERQLCVIAKALIQQAPILLLDEPTSFLDYSNKILLMKSLKKIAFEENLLIIQANHDVDLCFDFSDSILWIDSENKSLNELNINELGERKKMINKIFNC